MKKITTLFILLGLVGTFLSCGYTTGSTLPSRLQTIHIEPFDNEIDFTASTGRQIYLPLLEVAVRNAVIDRFLFDGNLRIADVDVADLVLRGALTSYRRGGLRFSDNDDVEEYRVYVTVSLTMWDTHLQEAMWVESSFVGEGTYFISGPTASSEETAVSEAVTDLARRIVERTIENW